MVDDREVYLPERTVRPGEIDRVVYQLYELAEDEIAIVEGRTLVEFARCLRSES